MKVIIDRFEGNFAVCEMEDMSMISLEKDKLPKGVAEGVVLNIDSDIISIDEYETKKRAKISKELLNDLF